MHKAGINVDRKVSAGWFLPAVQCVKNVWVSKTNDERDRHSNVSVVSGLKTKTLSHQHTDKQLLVSHGLEGKNMSKEKEDQWNDSDD